MTDFADLVPAPAGRFEGIERPYTAAEVKRLRGSLTVEHTLARRGANRLWELLGSEDYVNALGALSGNQAMQMVRAGLQAIYLSCSAPTRSSIARAGRNETGSSPSSPTPRPVSAAP